MIRRLTLCALALTALALLVAGIATGAIGQLLAPRVWPRTIIGATALALLTLLSLFGGRHRATADTDSHATGDAAGADAHLHTHHPLRLWPLLVPLVLVPAALAGTSADQAGVRLFTAGGSLASSSVTRAPIAAIPLPDGAADGSWVGEANPALDEAAASLETAAPFGERDAERRAREAQAMSGTTGRLIITDEEFAERVDLIWDYPDLFAGRPIELTVFAFREEGWPVSEFAAARMSIWCCAADAAVVGLLAESEPATAPPTGRWMRLRGTLGVRPAFDSGAVAMTNLPVIREVSWQPVDPPAMEYVFPPGW